MVVVGDAEIKIGADSAAFAGDIALLGAGLLPVLASATVGVTALAGSLAGAGAALGVFGLVFKSAFKDVKQNISDQDKLNATINKYKAAADAAKKGSDEQKAALAGLHEAQKQQKQDLEDMTKPQRAAFDGYNNMTTSWEKFKSANEGDTLGIMAGGLNLIAKIIPMLQPLFDVGAAAVKRFMKAAEHWVDKGGLKGLIDYLAGNGYTTLLLLGQILKNLGKAFGNIFSKIQSKGGGTGLLVWLDQITAKFAGFTGSKAFTDFLDKTASQTPAVVGLLGSLAKNIGTIAKALTPLAPVSLAIASALSILINTVPVPVITAIVGAFIAFSLAMKANAAATIIANVAIGIWTALTWLATAATAAWAAATWLLDAAILLLGTPVVIAIAIIVALIAVIVLIAVKTHWFQDIWAKAWPVIKAVAVGIWEAIKWAAQKSLDGIVSAFQTTVGIFKALWNAVVAAAKFAWAVIKNAAVVTWNDIKGVASAGGAAIKAIWNAIKAVATGVWSAVKSTVSGAIHAITGFVSSGVASIKSKFQAIRSAITSINLYGAGRALIQGLINGIKSAIGGAVDAVKGGLGKIKSLLPGSPIKDGPLKSWNGGGAGKRLMGLVAKGIDDGSDAVSASAVRSMGGVSRALDTGGRAAPVAASGGDTYITVAVSVDDLARMSTIGDFIDMLSTGRATARKTQRSGTVTA